MASAVVFGDSEVDNSAIDDVMMITDRQVKSQVDQDKLKKEEKARAKKLARREREEAAAAAEKGPDAVKELAVASQVKFSLTLKSQKDSIYFSKKVKNLIKILLEQAISKTHRSENGDIVIENFDLTFGSTELMCDAELNLAKGRRYGLVGRNGAGKSTLLRALHRNCFFFV